MGLGHALFYCWQVIDSIEFTSWLAALDDFRNWLIREAA